jgi:hypothetical protein
MGCIRMFSSGKEHLENVPTNILLIWFDLTRTCRIEEYNLKYS